MRKLKQDNQYEEKLEEEEQIDPNEVNGIISGARDNKNPIIHEEEQQLEKQSGQPSAVYDQEDTNLVSNADEECR